MALRELTFEQLLGEFYWTVWGKIKEQAARPDVTHIVMFENMALDSLHCGDRTAMAVGPGCTYKWEDITPEGHLYDLPSMRQYPVAYANVEDYHGEDQE